MRLNQKQVGKQIDQLMAIRAQLSVFNEKAHNLTLSIKDAGGGESKYYRAFLVPIPKHTVIVRAHKRLDVRPK